MGGVRESSAAIATPCRRRAAQRWSASRHRWTSASVMGASPFDHRPTVDLDHAPSPVPHRHEADHVTLDVDLELGIRIEPETVADVLGYDHPTCTVD
ncbi:MAG: hypothetical protein R2716_00180 [Microthrixaceae bacterium]